MGKLPKKNDGVMMRTMGQEAMLYDTANEMIHIINQTAAVVWECCDGECDVKEVARRLSKSFAIERECDLEADIIDIINQFFKLKLVNRGYGGD